MSRKYYIKDKNGAVLSSDGQTRFKVIEGAELYSYLQSEERKGKYFYFFKDEDGDVVGFECTQEQFRELENERQRNIYRIENCKKKSFEIISGNQMINDTETEVELFETIADETADIEEIYDRQEMIEKIIEVLDSLSEEERHLIDALYLSKETQSERQYSKETGIPQKTINYRKKKILEKIKSFL